MKINSRRKVFSEIKDLFFLYHNYNFSITSIKTDWKVRRYWARLNLESTIKPIRGGSVIEILIIKCNKIKPWLQLEINLNIITILRILERVIRRNVIISFNLLNLGVP